jgi:phage-related protein
MVERVEERIRNMVGSFYNVATMLKNLDNEKVSKYLFDHAKDMSETMINSINYLIDLGTVMDENLPNGFDINEHIDKTKYQKKC